MLHPSAHHLQQQMPAPRHAPWTPAPGGVVLPTHATVAVAAGPNSRDPAATTTPIVSGPDGSTSRYHPYARPPAHTSTTAPTTTTATRSVPMMPLAGPTSSIPSPAGAPRHPPSSSSSSAMPFFASSNRGGLPASSSSLTSSFSAQHHLVSAGIPPGAIFAATLENVRLLAPLLRAVHMRDWISLLLTPRGIRASVCDAAGSVQATAYIARNVFRSYHYDPPSPPPPPRAAAPHVADGGGDVASSRELLASPGDDDEQDEPGPPAVREMQLTVDMPTLLDVLNVYNSAHLHISHSSSSSSSSTSLEAHAAAVAAGISGSSGSRGGGQQAHPSLGGVTSLTLWCTHPDTSPLELALEEQGVKTRAALHTFSEPDGAAGGGVELEAAWEAHGPPVYKMILGAGVLRDALAELGVRDVGAAAAGGAGRVGKVKQAVNESSSAVAADRIVSLSVLSPPPASSASTPTVPGGAGGTTPTPVPQLLLSTSGPAGSATVALAGAAMDVFQSRVPEFTATYPAGSLDGMMRALALAKQVSVRANALGFLSVQCLVQVRVDVASFIEFVVAPIEADEVEGAGGGGLVGQGG